MNAKGEGAFEGTKIEPQYILDCLKDIEKMNKIGTMLPTLPDQLFSFFYREFEQTKRERIHICTHLNPCEQHRHCQIGTEREN